MRRLLPVFVTILCVVPACGRVRIAPPSPQYQTLEKLESRALEPDATSASPVPLPEDGAAAYLELLKARNRALFDRVQQCARGEHRPGATFVIGPAGIGKSWLLGEWSGDRGWPVIDLERDDLEEHAADWLEEWPDVRPETGADEPGALLSTLPRFTRDAPDGAAFAAGLMALYGVQPDASAVFIVDALDEIHPDSTTKVIEAFAVFAERDGKHVFLAGRPEAFVPYFQRTNVEPARCRYIHPVAAYSPHVVRALVASARDYKWNPSYNAAAAQRLIDFLIDNPDMADTISNPTNGRFLLEWIVSDLAEDPRESVLSAMLARNARSHNRPDADDEAYRALLATIARRYAFVVDEEGWFEVAHDETVEIESATGARHHYTVTNVLDRSGVILRDPDSLRSARYRFTPIWLHRYLAESAREASP